MAHLDSLKTHVYFCPNKLNCIVYLQETRHLLVKRLRKKFLNNVSIFKHLASGANGENARKLFNNAMYPQQETY